MKTALVTGANRGIGLELTAQLLEAGYNVHATYRSSKGGLDEFVNSNLVPPAPAQAGPCPGIGSSSGNTPRNTSTPATFP